MKRVLAVLAVMLLLVVGAACGSSDEAKPAATSVTGASTAGATSAATQAEAEETEDTEEPTEASGGAALPEGNAENGKALATSLGCVACHSTDGTALTGPTWKGVYGHEVKLADGSTVTADDAYIHESIVDPNAKVVEGFSPIMPSFASQVDDQKVADIIAYIKTLE